MDDIIPSLLYGLMWVSGGIATIIESRRPPAKIRNLLGWKIANGKITQKGLIQEVDDKGDPIYIPFVEYEYYVGELCFSIKKTTFNPDSLRDDSDRDQYWDEQEAEKVIKDHVEDSVVNVYYAPSNFKESLLDYRPMSAIYNLIAIGFMIYGIYILYSCLIRHSCMDIVTIIED